MTNNLRFAPDHATEGLFKLKPYSTETDRNRVKEILRGEIYFSTRSQLNDPFEMQLMLAPGSNFAARVKGMVRSMRDNAVTKHLSPARRLEQATRASRLIESNPEILRRTAQQHVDRMSTGCFIFCMSGNRTHPLLWSHYADSHKGICVHFDHKKDPFYCAAEVDYSPDFPRVAYPFEGDAVLTQKGILTKAKFWKYEEEFRLFSVRMGNEAWHLGLKWLNKHIARIDPTAVIGITLGANMPHEDAEELVEHCSTHHPHIAIEQARLRESEFGLEFSPI